MSNDKTLATAKHGGCVQLGDGLLPCPFCGNGAEFVPYKNNGLTLKCKSMGCIQRHQRTLRYGIEWLRTSMTEHWNGRALSAQPSPGGQGAPRCAQHCQNGFADICLASQRDGVICPEDSCDIDDGIRHNHLAARQPVGDEERAETYRKGWEAGNAAQAMDLGPVRSALQAAAALCDCCASVDGYSRSELNAFGQNMRSQFTDAMALIDSKAVGK